MYRESSADILADLESTVRQCGGRFSKGLVMFQQPKELEMRDPDPRTWPRLGLDSDKCGTQLCAVSWATRKLLLNIDFKDDDPHGLNNDLKLLYAELGEWAHVQLMMGARNYKHGPWNEALWGDMSHCVLDEVLNKLNPSEDVLLQHLQPFILEESADPGDLDEFSPVEIDDFTKEVLCSSRAAHNFGEKSVFARFCDYLEKGAADDKVWHSKLYHILTCLMLTKKLDAKNIKMFSTVVKDALNREIMNPESTAASHTSLNRAKQQQRAVREHSSNQLFLAGMMYGEDDNQCRERIFHQGGALWRKWNGHGIKARKTVDGGQKYVYEQCRGQFLEVVNGTLALCSNSDMLEDLKLKLPAEVDKAMAHMQIDDIQRRVTRDCNMADLFWRHQTGLSCLRLKRCAPYLIGWPMRFVLLLSDDKEFAEDVMDELRLDSQNFANLIASNTVASKVLGKRSLFNLTCVQQGVEVCKKFDWMICDEVVDWVKEITLRPWSTKVNEDAIRYLKAASNNAPNKQLSEDRAWYTLIKSPVLTEEHKFKDVNVSDTFIPRNITIPKELYRAARDKHSCWPALNGVRGPGSKIKDCFSPGPPGWNIPYADILFERHLTQNNRAHIANKAWLSCLARDLRSVIMRDTSNAAFEGKWVVPRIAFASLGIMCLRVELVTCDFRGKVTQFEKANLLPVPHFEVGFMLRPQDWEVRRVRFLPPRAQAQEWPEAIEDIVQEPQEAFLHVLPGPPVPIMVHVSGQAFGKLPLTTLKALGKEFNVSDISACSTLFQALKVMIMHFTQHLNWSEEVVLECIRHRCVRETRNPLIDEILESDEFIELMGPDDRQAVRNDAKKRSRERKNLEIFRTELAAARKALRESVSRAGGKGKGQAKKKGRGKGNHKGKGNEHSLSNWVGPERFLASATTMTQEQAKQHLPPGAKIWKAHEAWFWEGVLEPYPAHARGWVLWGGEMESLKLVLQAVWRDYLDQELLDESACPVGGLF